MKKLFVTVGVATACALAGTFAYAAENLNLYISSGYISPDLVKQFEKESGIKVNIDNYDSDETLLAKLKQGGAGYDIAVAGQATVSVLAREGLIEKVQTRDLPGYNNILPQFRKPEWDPTGSYSIPYLWGTTNFAVDKGTYAGDIDSFKVLFEPPPQLQGKINMLLLEEDMIGLASIYLGVPFCSENTQDLQKVQQLLIQQKPFIRTYNGKAGAVREAMVSGEIAMSSIYSGTSLRTRELKKTIQYAYPKEGSLAWVDNVVVPKGAPNLGNAKQFLTFLLKPQVAAMNTNFLKYQNPVEGSAKFVDTGLQQLPELNPPATSKLHFLKSCSESAIRLHDRLWTNLLK